MYRKAKGTATAPVRKGGYLLAKGGSSAGSPVVSVAKSTGQAYRLWKLSRKLDDGVLDKLTTTQRQELGHLLSRLDKKGVRLSNELGPREIQRLLAQNADDHLIVKDGVVVRANRHDIEVEARYVDDGDAYVTRLADGEDLSKGAIGEEAAYDLADRRNYEIPEWFEKDSTYQNGIDLIAKDPESGKYVFIESKFTSSRGSMGIGDLSKTETKGRQMSDEWLLKSIDDMYENDKITKTQWRDLRDAVQYNGKKEMVVVKNTEKSGFTVVDSLNEVSINRVTIYKTGKVIE